MCDIKNNINKKKQNINTLVVQTNQSNLFETVKFITLNVGGFFYLLYVFFICFPSGPVVGEFLPALLPLLKSCLEPSRDPEMRLHIFTMLSKLLLDSSNTLDSQGSVHQTQILNFMWLLCSLHHCRIC